MDRMIQPKYEYPDYATSGYTKFGEDIVLDPDTIAKMLDVRKTMNYPRTSYRNGRNTEALIIESLEQVETV